MRIERRNSIFRNLFFSFFFLFDLEVYLKFRNSARRTSQETGQRVLRARRARTRPMWPNGQTDRDAGQIGRDDRRATYGTVQYSCSPSCAPSSTSSADFGTRF